jgi:hypothetical protein
VNPFDAVGNFFGGLFGQKKKRDDQPRPQVTVQRPSSISIPVSQSVSPQMPGSLIQDDQQQNQNQPFSLNLGGVQAPSIAPIQMKAPDLTVKPQPSLSTPGQRLDAALHAPKQNTAPSLLDNAETGMNRFNNIVRGIGGSIVKGAVDLGSTAVDTSSHIVDDGLGRNGIGGLFGQDWSPHLVDKTKGVSDALHGVSQGIENLVAKDTQKAYTDRRTGLFDSNNPGVAASNLLFSAGQFVDPATLVGGVAKGWIKASDELAQLRDPNIGFLPQASTLDNIRALTDKLKRNDEPRPIEPIVLANEPKPVSALAEEPAPTPRDPSSPITSSPTTNKPPAITSANPEFKPPTVQAPQPVFTAPEAVGPKPPMVQGVQMPEAKMPQVVQKVQTPDEVVATAQKAIDDAAVQAPVQPAPAEVVDIQSPKAAETQRIAEAQVPVAPVSEVQMAQEAANKAPTEAIASNYTSPHRTGKAGVPGNAKVSYNTGDPTLDAVVNDSIIAHKGTASTAETRAQALDRAGVDASMRAKIRNIATKSVDKETGVISTEAQAKIRQILSGNDTPAPRVEPVRISEAQPTHTAEVAPNDAPTPVETVDPRVTRSNAEADELIATANKELAKDGGSYAQVVRKLYNNNRPDGKLENLTSAERAVANRIQPKLDRVLSKMNDLGLTDADMGLIADYLPTKKLDELGQVRGLSDVEGQDFGFTKTRGNKLDDAQVEQGAEQALKDYLATGELLDDLSPEVIGKVKLARRDKEFTDLIEKDGKGGDTGLRLTDEEIQQSRADNQKLIDAETARSEAQKKVAQGDTKPETISELNKAENDANDAHIQKQVDDYITLERKVDAEIANIRSSNELTSETKKQRIAQLEAHLTDVRNQTYYMQSTVRTNLLFGVGRIADQVNKGIVGAADKITAGARLGANSSFNKATGRDLFADNPTVSHVWDNVKNKPSLNQGRTNTRIAEGVLNKQNEGKGLFAKLTGGYRMAGTRVTEAGSRYRIASKDAVSYFVSKAKAEGLTDVSDITQYVEKSIGTSEWSRVHTALFETRNSFAGLPASGRVASRDMRMNVRNSIYNKLGSIPGLSRSMRENIADGVTIPIIGFPRMMFRLGVRGLDNATLGVGDFIKAATINPRTEADALKKALLVQQGFRSAQNGATLGALGVMLGAAGMTTGAYPADDQQSERSRWEKDKIQPFSLKLGDQYIDVGRYAGPLAFPLMMGAALGRGQSTDIPATAGELVQQISKNYGADSVGDVLQTAGSLMKGDFQGAGKDTTRWLAGMTAAFVPASSALNTAGKAEDMALGNAAPDGSGSYTDSVRSRFPVIRDGLPERTDSLGNPISQGNAFDLLPGVSGGQDGARAKSDSRDDSLMGEINRLSKAKFEVMPARDVKNSNSQHDASTLMSSKLYKKADDETKASYLKDTLLGTKTKDINKSLNDAERSSLIEYTLQNDDQRRKWLEDNDNAAGYYAAKYNNMKANDTLTSNDENLDNKSGARYEMLRAQVNKEFGADTTLQQLYRDTDTTEWKKMTDPESEDYDPDTAGKLMAYDEARTKAGVSGKSSSSSKPKYTLSTAKGGKGGKGGKGSDNFAFASLPGSLVGSSNSKGYADDAPTFKPIADLKAPASAQIPRGRGISVKKGIQI